jgi:hypothetical protein
MLGGMQAYKKVSVNTEYQLYTRHHGPFQCKSQTGTASFCRRDIKGYDAEIRGLVQEIVRFERPDAEQRCTSVTSYSGG